MKRVLFFLIVPAAVAALVGAFALTSGTTYSSGPGPKPQQEYLALGDSLGWGYGASDPATKGYVPLFRDFLESDEAWDTDLLLNNLSIPGATSASLISQQLPAAVAELEARNGDRKGNNDVKVVTVDIGGNDVLALLQSPACVPAPTAGCFALAGGIMATFAGNFDHTLGELRAAAGPGTTMIVMTYYNSLEAIDCGYNLLAPLGDVILEGGPGLPVGLNDVIRAIAGAHGAAVADTFGRLAPGNILPDCVHANDSGYAIIADTFADTFEDD